ncbi:MAG: TetR/AcrR family transcriptional regulator [Fimbriimonas sp.]
MNVATMPDTIDVKDRAAARDRLLDVAERLFALRGVAETSVRAITAEAGMNVAAVNYYFASKDQLFEAVMDRRLPPLIAARERQLSAALAGGGEVESILRALIEPSIRLGFEHPSFARLASRLRYEDDPGRWQNYRARQGDLPTRFRDALAAALPHLEIGEVERRMQFVLGAIGHVWATLPPKCGETADCTTARLVNFYAAGMRAPATR